MKRTLSMIALAVLTIGLLGSCSKINERLDNLEKKVSGIENEQIASINSQIDGIKTSIADLGTIRSDISSLKQSASDHSVDIFNLEEADRALKDRILNLEDYVDAVLPNYAEKEWVEATFSTLEQYEATCDTIAKIDARIGALDTKLSKDIKATADSLTKWVNKTFEGYYTAAEMDASLAQMKSDIDSARAANKISDAKADSIAGELAKVKPEVDTAKANIRAEYKAAVKAAIEESEGKLTKELTDAISEVNDKIESLVTRVDNLATEVDKLTGRVKALEEMIQSVVIVPAYSDGSVDAKAGFVTVNIIVEPASAVAALDKSCITVFVNTVKTKSVSLDTAEVVTLEIDTETGIVSILADISEYLPEGEDKALTVAVNIKNGISDFTTEFVPVTPIVEYVEIKAKYDGSTVSTLRWYRQSLAITASGKKAWKGDSGSPVKVPGTGEDVVVGDYFQWGTFAGFYGSGADSDKGLLPYSSFTSTGCGDGSDAFTFKDGKQFKQTNAPYWSGSAYTKYNATDGKTALDASDDVASIILGGTWRMPTTKEFQAMKEVTYWAWDATDKGYYVYTPNPASDAGKVNDGTGTYNKADALLFFPAAGNGYENTYWDAGYLGDFWTGSLYSANPAKGCILYLNGGEGRIDAASHDSDRYRGYSVRPVQDPAATYVAVTNVSLDVTAKEIEAGGNVQLKVTVAPAAATQNGVYWTSSAPTVATVDATGKVTAVAAGTATITATTVDGSQTATCTVTVTRTVTFKAVYNATGDANTLTFYYDAVDHSGEGTVYDNLPTAATGKTSWGYDGVRKEIKKVVITESVKNYSGLTSTAYMFQGMTAASDISGAEYLDVSNVTDMSWMFQNFGGGASGSPTTLNSVPDVSGWDTGNVTNMTAMFESYGNFSSSLDKVPDVSGWNTGNVTDMTFMFQKYGHESQNFNAVPDVSGWNTGNVEDMHQMFFEYGHKSTALNTVPDVSGWNTGNVTNMSGMFNGYGYTSTNISCVLDLSGWDLSKITGTNGGNVFNFNPKTFDVTIPAKTGEKSNEGGKWYYGNGGESITPPEGKTFTPASTISTIADVLATAGDNAPSAANHWNDTKGNYIDTDNELLLVHIISVSGGASGDLQINLDYTVTPSGDNYLYSNWLFSFTFNMTEGVLTSIYVDLDAYGVNDTFSPAPTPTTTGTAKRTGDIDVNWVQLWENGPKFAEYNVGVTDGKAESFGGYYCWGSITEQSSSWTQITYETFTELDIATSLWGDNWRMPTTNELNNLINNCTWTEIDGVNKKYNGTSVKGILVTGKGDYASNSIFLPATGRRNSSGLDKSASGYWTATSTIMKDATFFSMVSTAGYLSLAKKEVGSNLIVAMACPVRAVLKE